MVEEFDDGYTCNQLFCLSVFFVFLSFLSFCLLCLSVFFVFLPSSCLLVLSLARCLRGSWACNCLEAAPIPRWVFEAASLPFLHQLRLQYVFLGQKLVWRVAFLKFIILKKKCLKVVIDGFLSLPCFWLHHLTLHYALWGQFSFFSKKCLKILTDNFCGCH